MNSFQQIPETSKTSSDQTTVISIYFSGTNDSLKDGSFAGILLEKTEGNFKKGFDGCAISKSTLRSGLGWVFAMGLEGQVDEAVAYITSIMKEKKKIVVNCYGFSRGGIAAFRLAKKLSFYNYDPNYVELNLAVLDPVPGNLRFTTEIDFLNLTLTNQARDLTKCKILKNVLVIYSYTSGWFMSPLIPDYPSQATVQQDVYPGDHMEFGSHEKNKIVEFLRNHGTAFSPGDLNRYSTESRCLDRYSFALEKLLSGGNYYISNLHSKNKMYITAKQIENKAENGLIAVNKHHAQLIAKTSNKVAADFDLLLSIQEKPGIYASITRTVPLRTILRWLFVGALVSSIIFVSGGFAAIPIPLLAGLGAAIIPAAMPVVGIVMASVWKLMNVVASCFSSSDSKTVEAKRVDDLEKIESPKEASFNGEVKSAASSTSQTCSALKIEVASIISKGREQPVNSNKPVVLELQPQPQLTPPTTTPQLSSSVAS